MIVQDYSSLKPGGSEIRNLNIRTRIAVILILETESAKQIIQISAMIMSVGAHARDDDLDEDL